MKTAKEYVVFFRGKFIKSYSVQKHRVKEWTGFSRKAKRFSLVDSLLIEAFHKDFKSISIK